MDRGALIETQDLTSTQQEETLISSTGHRGEKEEEREKA